MRSALANKEFSIAYQPIIDLRSGAVLGAECLLRWDSPEHGSISPARFIPIAERSGLIIEIGNWVLNQAGRQLQSWRGTHFSGLELSVNVSTLQFKRGTLDAVITRVVEDHDFQPHQLKLEVTESALIDDPDNFVMQLGKLKAIGVRLAVDDFGTGYSNLSYLQRFEVDTIKVDQFFIRGLKANAQNEAIVQAILQVTRALNLKATAEGVEDENTRNKLVEMGCDCAQGYFFARPMPLPDFERVVALQSKRPETQRIHKETFVSPSSQAS